MNEKVLLREDRGQIAILTINRPDARNSVSRELLGAFAKELDALRFDPNIRVIIITGAGDRAFCAGADLKERATMNETEVREFIHTIRNLFTELEDLPKPVIAGVNGAALGGGTELALASDLRIASDNATLGLTETRLGIIPGAGGTQRLPRLIGKGKAKELIFTGKRVDAEEALSIGLVNRVCPFAELLDECMKMAEMILEAAPIAVQQAKYAVNRGMETDLATGLAIESNAYWITIPTQDRLEALAAFREKRKPVFQGK